MRLRDVKVAVEISGLTIYLAQIDDFNIRGKRQWVDWWSGPSDRVPAS
jgi:hypothetical protein